MLLLVEINYLVIEVIRWLYLDGGWWNIHSSGMLKYIYWKQYFLCAQQWVARIIYHRLGQGQVTFNIIVLILLFAPSTFIHLETLVSIYDLIPLSICIKTNFITVPDLCVSWRNIIEVRRYVHIFSKGWSFFTLFCEY